jgi:hypothetical protein
LESALEDEKKAGREVSEQLAGALHYTQRDLYEAQEELTEIINQLQELVRYE